LELEAEAAAKNVTQAEEHLKEEARMFDLELSHDAVLTLRHEHKAI